MRYVVYLAYVETLKESEPENADICCNTQIVRSWLGSRRIDVQLSSDAFSPSEKRDRERR